MLLNIIYELIILLDKNENININIEYKEIYNDIYTMLTIPLKNIEHDIIFNDVKKSLKVLKEKLMKTKNKDFLYIISYFYKIDSLKINIFIGDIQNDRIIN